MKLTARSWWPALALAVLVFAAYANSFTAGFVIDSRAIILEDPRIRSASLEWVRRIFTEEYWWPTATSELYRPLTTLSFWFNYTVLGNGANPLGYHILNFGLHLANVLLVWRLGLRLIPSRLQPWLAAAFFGLHPVAVEAVTNLVGRADLLATFGVLVAVLAWIRAEETSRPLHSWGWLALAAAASFTAVFAKETGVMVIAAIGLVILRRHGTRDALRHFLRRGLFVAVPALLAMIGARLWIYARIPPVGEVHVTNLFTDWQNVMTAIGVLGRYLVLLVWPASLSCDYSYPQIPPFGSSTWATVQTFVSLVVITILAILAWKRRTDQPCVAFGLAWGAAMMLPTSNMLVQIGSNMAERFLYLPLTGFALVGAAILVAIKTRLEIYTARSLPGAIVVAACLALLAGRTFARNFDWRDECSIWQSAARVSPRSFQVQMGLATCALQGTATEAKLDAAIGHAERARALLDSPPLPIERENNTVWPELGKYYRIKAEYCAARGDSPAALQWAERARVVLEKSVAVNRWVGAEVKRRYTARGNAAAAAQTYGNPRIYEQLALVQLNLNRTSEAEATLLERRRIDPTDAETLLLLGIIARDRRTFDVAASRFLQAVLLASANERAWRELEDVYKRMGVTPSPITLNAKGGNITATSALIRSHLDSACVELVASFQLAGRTADAEQWKQRAIHEFGTNPNLFRP